MDNEGLGGRAFRLPDDKVTLCLSYFLLLYPPPPPGHFCLL